MKLNAALTETVTAFDPQMPLGGPMNGNHTVPAAMEMVGEGKLLVRFEAPEAKTVAFMRYYNGGPTTEMEKGEDGVWSAVIDCQGEGYSAIFFLVDGVYVLNPMGDFAWSQSHPINYIDIPGEGREYYLCNDTPHGTIARDVYYSKTCGCMKGCVVYTPPGYNKGEYNDLPVLYLQHGYGENETSWTHLGKVNWIMDNLIAEKAAVPMIIVMNNGMVQTAAEDGGRTWNPLTMERMLIDDCIPYIEANYRVATDKWSRAMAGLSMGSMQTSVITLKNPDLFGYAGIFSGFLGMLGGITDVNNEHFAAFEDKDKLFANYKLFFRCMGNQDEFFHVFKEEGKMLAEKGLSPAEWTAHKETIYDGFHDWNVWRPCVRDFLKLVFK
jgi:enterochelin esterase-like enzyme